MERISKMELLADLVECDNRDHSNKALAKFFLESMECWPDKDQKEISVFVTEIKDFFGTPLIIKKEDLHDVGFAEGHNVWKIKAGRTISQMLDFSKSVYDNSDFDNIINKIFEYYEQELENVDFLAKLEYRTTEQGGRNTPAHSGYRPLVKFEFSDMMTTGQQLFFDKPIAFPGDILRAKVKIVSVDFFANKLSEGMCFEFREGERIIGSGLIEKVINEKLKRPAANIR